MYLDQHSSFQEKMLYFIWEKMKKTTTNLNHIPLIIPYWFHVTGSTYDHWTQGF